MPERITLEPIDPRYPPQLRINGDADILARRDIVAVCGARRCTPYGAICAQETGRTVADTGMILLAGGAVGTQTAAIEAALERGGQCIVMFGSGLGQPYPERNIELFRRVVEAGGAIVSPHGDDTPPLPFHFRNRNDLIVSMSMCLVVVEAGLPSGTFSMADRAAELGRPVLAWPGQVTSPQSAGSNAMIAMGMAACLDSADTLAERLHLMLDNAS